MCTNLLLQKPRRAKRAVVNAKDDDPDEELEEQIDGEESIAAIESRMVEVISAKSIKHVQVEWSVGNITNAVFDYLELW